METRYTSHFLLNDVTKWTNMKGRATFLCQPQVLFDMQNNFKCKSRREREEIASVEELHLNFQF